jgi:hypothetical protein
MDRFLDINILLGAFAISVLSGCTAPDVRTAPPPSPQQLALNHQVQVRAIAIPVERVFPKILDVLMDNGFIVRSANEKVGFVSFYQQWTDVSQGNANITLEGSILFKSAGPNSTEARVVLTGSWQRLSLGTGNSASSMVSGVQQSPGAEQYATVLDAIEHGLISNK